MGAERRAVEVDRVLERLDHALEHQGDHGRGVDRAQVGEQDQELVAALSGHQVDVARRTLQARCQPREQEVARVMAHRVVEMLEVVEVEVEHGDRGVIPACALDRQQQRLAEQFTVRETPVSASW